MNKICANCDNSYNRESAICPNCGSMETRPPRMAKLKKQPAKGLIIGIGALVALAIVFLLFSLAFNKPFTSALDNYYLYTYTGDEDALEAMVPPEYWDWCEDRYSMTKEDLIASRETQMSANQEYYEDFLGEDLRFTYEFRKTTQYTDHQLELFAEALEDTYDIDPDSVSRAYYLVYDMTIRGENGVQVLPNQSMGVIEIDNCWYIFSPSNSDGEMAIRFAT